MNVPCTLAPHSLPRRQRAAVPPATWTMSCQCNACGVSIAAPDSIWYAVTRHASQFGYVCGTCVARIPQAERVTTAEQREFDPTFGPILAETGSAGRYQGSGSRMLSPQFYVPFEVVERLFHEHSELVLAMERHCRPDRFLSELVEAHAKGTWGKWPGESWPLGRVLTVQGALLERALGLSPPGKAVRPALAPFECREPTPEQERLAEELWQAILAWDREGRPPLPRERAG